MGLVYRDTPLPSGGAVGGRPGAPASGQHQSARPVGQRPVAGVPCLADKPVLLAGAARRAAGCWRRWEAQSCLPGPHGQGRGRQPGGPSEDPGLTWASCPVPSQVLESMALTVDLVGPAPWGFRISGGRDFHTPIVVTRVTEEGKAEAADLRPGDIIVAINGESAKSMLHAEAQSKIRQSPSPLRLQLDRPQVASPGQTNGESSPEVLATRFQGSRRTHTDSQSSLRSSCSSQASLSPPPGSPFSTLPPASPQAPVGEVVPSHSFQSLAYSPEPTTADHLSYRGRLGSRQNFSGDPPANRLLTSPQHILRGVGWRQLLMDRPAWAVLATRLCWFCRHRLPQVPVPPAPGSAWPRKGKATS
uniref:PDZ and LIM domain protein 2 isoform X4 n=1 Tax=Tursiops truncatus TaxID=9739 RepID=A0A6J3RHW5_TURTR|nr:PDZ and LIM domain protein 2 isoform X4 [Tursiops truncatus]